MFEFSEIRPSYNNLLEFFKLAFQLQYIPIYCGFLVLLGLTLYVLRSRQSIHVKLLSLYFSLSFFTNFAYQFHKARIFDFVGITISLIAIAIVLKDKLKIWFCEKVITVVTAALLLHLFVLYGFGYLHEYEDGNAVFLERLVMISRVGVLFFVILYFTNFVRRESQIAFIISTFKYTGLATLFIMLIQELMFFGFGLGTVGLNFATGGIPLPRFGSVAIEAGHFGRLIPTFLLYLLAQKRYGLQIVRIFVASVVVALTNVSGSLYGYLSFFFAGILITDKFIFRIKNCRIFAASLAVVGAGVATCFYQYALLFYWKISGLIFSTNEHYRNVSIRSVDFLPKALSEFPLGIGFGVSDRFLPDGTYTDMGFYAVISQISILSLIVIFVFVYYWWYIISRFVRYKKHLIHQAYAPHAFVMVLTIPFIFFFDIVWLYPGYILPFLVLMVYIKKEEFKEVKRIRTL